MSQAQLVDLVLTLVKSIPPEARKAACTAVIQAVRECRRSCRKEAK